MQELLNSPLIVLIPILPIFYLLVIRPQQQRDKQRRGMIDNLRRGDTVVTAGGMVARVAKAPAKEDVEVTVEIADGVQVKVVKSTLLEVRAKNQPVDAKSDKS